MHELVRCCFVKRTDSPAYTSPVRENPVQRLILYVHTLKRKVLNNCRSLLIVGDALELHTIVHVGSYGFHEVDGSLS